MARANRHHIPGQVWCIRKKSSPRWKPGSRGLVKTLNNWIPAFAGMTKRGNFRLFTRPSSLAYYPWLPQAGVSPEICTWQEKMATVAVWGKEAIWSANSWLRRHLKSYSPPDYWRRYRGAAKESSTGRGQDGPRIQQKKKSKRRILGRPVSRNSNRDRRTFF